MQIGEAVAVLMGPPDECPFCGAEEEEPKLEREEISNDSSALAKNLGSTSYVVRNPDADEDYYIFNTYWRNQKRSKIGMNAHHAIPGNASLAKCTEIRKWLAGTHVIKKTFYDSKIQKKVEKVTASQADQERATLVAAAFPTTTLTGSPDAVVTYGTHAGKKGIHRENTVAKDWVTGKSEYDVNGAANGIWLPSSNAIANWSASWAISATNKDGDVSVLPRAYSYNAMAATGRQFHDAHPDYSTAVLKKLKELEIEVKKLAIACKDHEKSQANKNKGEPYPSPATLPAAINALSTIVKRELYMTKRPAPPWVTSKLALI